MKATQRALLAGLMATAIIFAPFGMAGIAHAAPVSGNDEQARSCRTLQNGFNAASYEASDPSKTPSEHAKLMNEMAILISVWKNNGCQDRFGNIAIKADSPKTTPLSPAPGGAPSR